MLRQVWLYGRILIGVALGVGVAYIIVREVNLGELLEQLSAFNWFLMIPVMAVVVTSNASQLRRDRRSPSRKLMTVTWAG